jgi:molybdopterin-guanine dinucleotide biosynthesis protein A
MKRPRLAFICDQDVKEELESWAKEENRTLSNLIESICKKAITDKKQNTLRP